MSEYFLGVSGDRKETEMFFIDKLENLKKKKASDIDTKYISYLTILWQISNLHYM